MSKYDTIGLTFESERLILRPYEISDAKSLVDLCGNLNIAKMTTRIPHPYHYEDALKFIEHTRNEWKDRKISGLAVILRSKKLHIGGIGLQERDKGHYVLGYWIGEPYWGVGYATEAARLLTCYGRDELNAKRITAWHMQNNPASGRVLEKAGYISTGKVVQHHCLARNEDMLCNCFEFPLRDTKEE